jgi:hypothetical protein
MEGILHHQGEDGTLVLTKDGRPNYYRMPLYFSVLGPDPSGGIDYSLEVPLLRRFDSLQVRAWVGDLADRPEDCFTRADPEAVGGDKSNDAEGRESERKKLPGCVTIRIPSRSPLPTLAARWSPSPRRAILRVSLDAKDLPLTVPDVSLPEEPVLARPTLMIVRVYGLTSGSSSTHQTELFLSLLSPDRDGAVTRSFRIAVPRRFTGVCVAASPVSPSDKGTSAPAVSAEKPECAEAGASEIRDASTVWTYLAVPPRRMAHPDP